MNNQIVKDRAGARCLGALLTALVALAAIWPAQAELQQKITNDKAPVLIGLDAEFGHKTSTSAEAIRRGMSVAIDEINAAGGVLGGRPLALEIRDNRSVPARGIENVKQLGAMPDLVAVFTGKFSPVVLEVLPTIHEMGLPLMAPWSAADGITHFDRKPNYAFRLSLTDTWALNAMLGYAREHSLQRVGLVLPNTGWGRSSLKAAEQFTARVPDVSLAASTWYNWGDKSLLTQYAQLRAAGAQAVILVANETEGAILVREVANLPEQERLPIISHWGVTGGEFVKLASPALAQVDFSVVQTFSFLNRGDARAQHVLAGLKRLFNVPDARSVESPVGVAHAYDLTHVLARAINLAGSTDRKAIRDALEKVTDYDGLIQHYAQPFAPDRHEALGEHNVFMARYAADGALEPIAHTARRN